jgi:hypothetical protein
MITMTGQRDIARCSIFRDDVDDLSIYIMPQSPRIALDDTGRPILSLVQYRRELSQLSEEERKTRLGGGILTLSVELSPTDQDMAEIRRTLSQDPGLAARLEQGTYRAWWLNEIRKDQAKLAAALKINSVPVVEGTVGIAVLAETPEAGHAGEFVATLVGAGRVSMTGRQRAAFMAKLTLDGAILLWGMFERNLPAIRVQYDLKYNHRLDGVRMIVWCDARKSYEASQEQWQHLNDNASWSEKHSGNSSHYTYWHEETNNARNRMFSAIKASETTRIEIIPEAGPSVVTPEQIAELTKIGNEMVKDFLASTFLEYKPGADAHFDEKPELKTELATNNGREYGHHSIDQYSLKTWNESMQANLDYQFKAKAVIEGHLAPQDNLSNVLGGRNVDEFRTQIDINQDWYRFLDVQVLCTADFENDPVELVNATLSYQARGPQGDISESESMVFRKGSPPGRFATYLASPAQRTFDYTYEVRYKGGQEVFRVSGKHDSDILILDTDSLGVLKVQVQLGLIDWERISQVFVKMWYGSGADRKEKEFTLNQTAQADTWTAVIGKPVDSDYTYEVIFLDKRQQRIPLAAATSRSRTLVINQPFEEDLEIAIVPSGSFADLLSQVIVATRYLDTPNNYRVDKVFTFSKSEPQIWRFPLRNKNLRTYEYQESVVYVDGVQRERDWRSSDKTVLPVGEQFNFRVQITPYLLKNPPGVWSFATLHLSFKDPEEGILAEKDFEVADFTKPLSWRFRTAAPDRHTYKYQLTLFKADGTEVKMQEQEYSREVLVLTPPPPA